MKSEVDDAKFQTEAALKAKVIYLFLINTKF